jgi:chromosome segregation ATPase
LEGKKYEFTDLQSQLSSTEERLNGLQQEYVKADSERDSLRDALRRFQNSVNRIMRLNRLRGTIDEVKYFCDHFWHKF